MSVAVEKASTAHLAHGKDHEAHGMAWISREKLAKNEKTPQPFEPFSWENAGTQRTDI